VKIADKLAQQPELPLKLKPSTEAKLFHGANGFDLSYWRLAKNKLRGKHSLWGIVELSDGALVEVTREGSGQSGRPRLYPNVPEHGEVQGRNFKGLLAQLALIDQIRALNGSIQIKLKQQDDAARVLSDLTKENVRDLQAENARLRRKLEALGPAVGSAAEAAGAGRERSQSINVPRLRGAYEQKGLRVTAKATLISFAIHADEGGSAWPSVERIASTWNMDRETARS
jgi:regulator of replication initiation timing